MLGPCLRRAGPGWRAKASERVVPGVRTAPSSGKRRPQIAAHDCDLSRHRQPVWQARAPTRTPTSSRKARVFGITSQRCAAPLGRACQFHDRIQPQTGPVDGWQGRADRHRPQRTTRHCQTPRTIRPRRSTRRAIIAPPPAALARASQFGAQIANGHLSRAITTSNPARARTPCAWIGQLCPGRVGKAAILRAVEDKGDVFPPAGGKTEQCQKSPSAECGACGSSQTDFGGHKEPATKASAYPPRLHRRNATAQESAQIGVTPGGRGHSHYHLFEGRSARWRPARLSNSIRCTHADWSMPGDGPECCRRPSSSRAPRSSHAGFFRY